MLGLFKKKLKPKWEFTKPGNLWRAMFLADSNKIIGEHRGQTEKKASFFLLDNATGSLVWDNFVLLHSGGPNSGKLVGDGWWIGLEMIYKHLVLLHSYVDPSVPEHMGLWALDSNTKSISWERPDISFISMTRDNKILAYKEILVGGFAERSFVLLDPMTGEELENLGQDGHRATLLRDQSFGLDESQEVNLPTQYTEKTEGFAEVIEAVQKHSNLQRVIAGFDIIHQNDRIILGYHEQTNMLVNTQAGVPVKSLNYTIKVIESDKVVFEDIIGKGMSGLLMDGFFTRNGHLYYVRERDTLCCIEV
ncbi:MAG: DUF4905 domain-containing protein [Chlorobiales bacterium]|nr:DUF4905 domain-containing protein [Chlorobiales bacterium]